MVARVEQMQEAAVISNDRTADAGSGPVSRRRLAKTAVVALAIAGFGLAGFSGALAKDGWDDDDWVFGASGGSGGSGGVVASGGSGGSGFDDDGVFIPSGGSGGSGGSGWDDDWDDWDDD